MTCVSAPALAFLSVVETRPCIAEWPVASIRQAESGTVTLLIQIGADGHILDPRLATSSGSQKLDKATIQAAALCRFRPAALNDTGATAWFKLQHEWKRGAPAHVLASPTAECAKPDWPNTAARFDEAPTVLLAFLVDENGKVMESRIRKTSGSKAIDNAAKTALAKCFFAPPMENGKPTQGWVQQSYTFTLE
jgi:TonB family protein